MSKNSLPNGVAAVPEKVPMQVPVKKDLKINTVKLFKPTDDVSRDSSDFVTNSLFILQFKFMIKDAPLNPMIPESIKK